jgi:hypothetical protein
MQTIFPGVKALEEDNIAILEAYKIKSNKIKGMLLFTMLIILG